MKVAVLKSFRYPDGDEWKEAAEGDHADVPDDQVESLVAQGFVAKPKGKAEKASVESGQ